jgi:multiple sugar transport system substrate-binding protein
MRNRLKHRYFFSLIAVFSLLTIVFSACGTSSASNGKKVVTVVYQQFGPPPYYDQNWWNSVQKQLDASHANIQLKLEPIIADEGDYYTKLDLMLRSPSTAPDLVREDSFLIDSDATAGYLAPLDSYLAKWPEYKQQWFPSMQSITTFNGHNYGVMDGTDVRLVWYNKDVFKKAGLPADWQPKTWSDVLSAAKTIKSKVPGVVPMNLYSGVPMDEASSMQGFEMLLYGTQNQLYDYKTQKWIVSSPGLEDSLNFVKQVYNSSDLLGPSNDIALSTQAGNTVPQQLLPQGKLGIDIDGSWLPSTWAKGGATPWPQWEQTMGMAKMPTQTGAAPTSVTLSGGWSYSIAAHSPNKDAAFQVLQAANSKDLLGAYDVAAAQIAPRQDIGTVPAYSAQPGSSFFSSLLTTSQFRPALPAYPKVSVQIDSAMQQVMQGKSASEAMAAYKQAVTGIVGAANTEESP